MKKHVRHQVICWIAFFLFLSLIEYLWDKATLPSLSQSQLIFNSLLSTLINIPPKILFAYYVWFFLKPSRHHQIKNIFFRTIEFLAVLFVLTTIDRLINNYIVIPIIYKGIIQLGGLYEERRVFIVLLYFALAAGILVSIRSLQQQLLAAIREKELVRQQLATELMFLRNQTNPHFLMNTLNNIYALARKKSEDTAEAVMRLSELLRFMLYESNGSLILLDEEIKVLEDYTGLESIRYNERLSLQFVKSIDAEGYRISPLLLLPFVENAFKHGVSESRTNAFIHISIDVKNAVLNLNIENSIADNATEQVFKNNIGLKNVQRQLELLYRDYTLNVQNSNQSYKTHLTVNLESYAEI